MKIIISKLKVRIYGGNKIKVEWEPRNDEPVKCEPNFCFEPCESHMDIHRCSGVAQARDQLWTCTAEDEELKLSRKIE